MKEISTILLSTTLLLSPLTLNSKVEASTLKQLAPEASTLNQLVPNPPTDSNDEIVPYGMNRPKSDAPTHDISINAYNYQIRKVGAQVYTDKLITGKKSINVSANNWTFVEPVPGMAVGYITITLFTSSGTEVDSKTLNIYGGSGSTSFSGLSPSTKYYVKFSVPRNKVEYSFDGSIS